MADPFRARPSIRPLVFERTNSGSLDCAIAGDATATASAHARTDEKRVTCTPVVAIDEFE
jgi:hypothetical protein